MLKDPERQAAQNMVRHFDLDGYAIEKAEQALQSTEAFVHLARASYCLEHATSCREAMLEEMDGSFQTDTVSMGGEEAWDKVDTALRALATEIIEDAMTLKIAGHEVNLQRSATLPCPVCNERGYVDRHGDPTTLEAEVYALGADTGQPDGEYAAYWLCKRCESVLHEKYDTTADSLEPSISVEERGEFAPEMEERD